MAQAEAAATANPDPRDSDLRLAHQLAFEKIRVATEASHSGGLVAQAVRELIDACEDYVRTR
jgi:hypothetical protein